MFHLWRLTSRDLATSTLTQIPLLDHRWHPNLAAILPSAMLRESVLEHWLAETFYELCKSEDSWSYLLSSKNSRNFSRIFNINLIAASVRYVHKCSIAVFIKLIDWKMIASLRQTSVYDIDNPVIDNHHVDHPMKRCSCTSLLAHCVSWSFLNVLVILRDSGILSC